jgi:hypothetical protein
VTVKGDTLSAVVTIRQTSDGIGHVQSYLFTDEKPSSITTYNVSPDGNVLTEETTLLPKKGTTKLVYERQ